MFPRICCNHAQNDEGFQDCLRFRPPKILKHKTSKGQERKVWPIVLGFWTRRVGGKVRSHDGGQKNVRVPYACTHIRVPFSSQKGPSAVIFMVCLISVRICACMCIYAISITHGCPFCFPSLIKQTLLHQRQDTGITPFMLSIISYAVRVLKLKLLVCWINIANVFRKSKGYLSTSSTVQYTIPTRQMFPNHLLNNRYQFKNFKPY